MVRLICLFLFVSCAPDTPPSDTPQQFWLVPPQRVGFTDDLDRASLHLALQRSLTYLQRLPQDRSLPFGDRKITVGTLRDTLEAFQHLLQQAATPEALATALREDFEVFQSGGRDGRGDVLFTGYYEMVLEGSRRRQADFPYPLYSRPPDLLEIDLGLFRPHYQGERLIARLNQNTLLPYYSRREIDTEGKLQGQGLELAWLRDPVEAFFLHIQGSGQIHLPDGHLLQVNYAGSNGHPYRSIGRLLLDEGRLTPAALSLQGLRHYFQEHPAERERVLSTNPRYIFFRRVEYGPVGSLATVLIPGRSMATDHSLFPPAALGFVQTTQPVFNAQGEVTGWQPLVRFVLNHDQGSAITGPGRVDLFWGSGAPAERAAGRLKHPGSLFFLLKRASPASRTENTAS